MSLSRATVATETPSRYILRLSKHWGHKFAVSFDPERSHIDLGDSTCELRADGARLQVAINAPQALLDEMEAVVAEHLQRFAPKDTLLAFDWVRDTAQASSAS